MGTNKGGSMPSPQGLASWFAIAHPRYRTLLGQLLVAGTIGSGLAYLDNYLLSALTGALSGAAADGALLSLAKTPWDVYPVGARVRIKLDGEQLGEDAIIPLNGLDGLYPDAVWDIVLE